MQTAQTASYKSHQLSFLRRFVVDTFRPAAAETKKAKNSISANYSLEQNYHTNVIHPSFEAGFTFEVAFFEVNVTLVLKPS